MYENTQDNNPTKEQITAEGHQWVFNAARKEKVHNGLKLAAKF